MSQMDGLAHEEDVRVDVVLYESGEVKAVPAGKGAAVVRSQREQGRRLSAVRRGGVFLAALLVVAYSLLVMRNLLLGVVAAALVVVAGLLLPRLTGTDADLLDESITLRDAREQWDATPVSALKEPAEGGTHERRRERDHAVEGEAR